MADSQIVFTFVRFPGFRHFLLVCTLTELRCRWALTGHWSHAATVSSPSCIESVDEVSRCPFLPRTLRVHNFHYRGNSSFITNTPLLYSQKKTKHNAPQLVHYCHSDRHAHIYSLHSAVKQYGHWKTAYSLVSHEGSDLYVLTSHYSKELYSDAFKQSCKYMLLHLAVRAYACYHDYRQK